MCLRVWHSRPVWMAFMRFSICRVPFSLMFQRLARGVRLLKNRGCEWRWEVRAELSQALAALSGQGEVGIVSVCVCVTLCKCAGNVGDRLKQSKKRGGCDDSSSTCCFSHCSSVLAALSRPTPASPAGDDATFLTSQTQPRSNAKYPSKRLLGKPLSCQTARFFFFF